LPQTGSLVVSATELLGLKQIIPGGRHVVVPEALVPALDQSLGDLPDQGGRSLVALDLRLIQQPMGLIETPVLQRLLGLSER
jgi:hypothetical protein